jgi:hypothetical protein
MTDWTRVRGFDLSKRYGNHGWLFTLHGTPMLVTGKWRCACGRQASEPVNGVSIESVLRECAVRWTKHVERMPQHASLEQASASEKREVIASGITRSLEHPSTPQDIDPVYCWVCGDTVGQTIGADVHTYHHIDCPCRTSDVPSDPYCARGNGCGEDVHEECCPSCHPHTYMERSYQRRSRPGLEQPSLGTDLEQ